MKGYNLVSRLFVPALLLVISSFQLPAQCVSGNCQNGTGSYRYSATSRYTGQFRANLRDGRGKMTLPNGAFYEGQFSRGKMQGEGTGL